MNGPPVLGTLLTCVVAAGCACAQSVAIADPPAVRAAYDRLLPRIEQIAIFDNHAHPGYASDPDVDAMASPPGSAPLRLRDDNPELAIAAKALFGYPFDDLAPEHARWLAEKKKQLQAGGGTAYFDGILDRAGIAQSAANRVAMPDYLDRKRFLWVCFVDSFLFPLDNSAFRARNSDEAVYIPLQEKKLRRELGAAGLRQFPATLSGYLAFITRTLEQNKREGAIAIKFEAAYFRSLYFSDPARERAASVYARYRAGGLPDADGYTALQDYVVRYLIREAGRLHLAVHFHTLGGIGDYFNLREGNVLNLENILKDPRYNTTTFVLLHGGWPYDRAIITFAARQNVYIDSSLLDLLLYPAEFASILRQWFEQYPDKIVFGSDAFPFSDALGAEECYWLGVRSTRTGLAMALAQMVALHEITEEKALKMARDYLHDTAAKLYRGADGRSPAAASEAITQ